MSEWKEMTLDEAVLINPQVKIPAGSDVPFVDMKQVEPGHKFVRAVERRTYLGGGSKFISGDTLMARITPCLENGKIGQYKSDNNLPSNGSTEFIVFRGKLGFTDNEYAYYLITSTDVRNFSIGQMTGTSGRQRVPMDCFSKYLVSLPSLPEQRAIAAVLGTLDDKIELNRRMNATLEAMARALFKSWFVDFDPVRAKSEGRQPFGMDAETAALFPSRLVPSTLGDIPEGWEVKPLGSVVEPQKGKSITRKTVSEGNVPVVAGGLEPAYYHDISNAQAPAITISASGANAGFVRLYHEDIWASDCSCINKSHTAFVYSIYSLLKNRQKEIYGMQQGAAQPHIYPSDIMRLEIVNAPLKIWQALEESVQPLFEKITANCSENKSLESVRDYLLPKLVSGDIRIPDATKFVEAA